MSGPPQGGSGCCPPRAEGITYLKLGPQGVTVGMGGLETVFTELRTLGRRPAVASDDELIGMARRCNWIPSNAAVEAEYANALREAYRAYYAGQETSRDQSAG